MTEHGRGERYAAYQLALTDTIQAIHDKKATEITLRMELMYDQFCQTTEESVEFFTWMTAQYASLYFELLSYLNLDVTDAAINTELLSMTLAAEMDDGQK